VAKDKRGYGSNKGHRHTPEAKLKMSLAHLGKHQPEEAKLKLSLAFKGRTSPFKGYHHTPEAKAKLSFANKGKQLSLETRGKLSLANLGKHLSEEARLKMGLAHKGQIPWNKGKPMSEEQKVKLREANLGKSLSEETKLKIGLANRGKHLTEETKAKIKEANTGKVRTEEVRLNIGKIHKEKWSNPEYREKQRHSGNCAFTDKNGENNPFFEKHHTEETRDKLKAALLGRVNIPSQIEEWKKVMQKYFDDEEWVGQRIRKSQLAQHKRPNKPETILLTLLDTLYPGEWKYVGDFSMTLGRCCPDFANVNGKKQLIEMYGDYYHKGQDPQDRIDYFKEYGFDTLVIWEHELKDTDAVVEKIKTFTDG